MLRYIACAVSRHNRHAFSVFQCQLREMIGSHCFLRASMFAWVKCGLQYALQTILMRLMTKDHQLDDAYCLPKLKDH